MGFFYETGYIRFEDRNGTKSPATGRAESNREKYSNLVVAWAIEDNPDLSSFSRIASTASSEYCAESFDTLAHHWDYKQFLDMERYVDFRTDQMEWADKGDKQDNAQKEAIAKARGGR